MNDFEQKMYYHMIGLAYWSGIVAGQARSNIENGVLLAQLTGKDPTVYHGTPEKLTRDFRNYFCIPKDEPITETLEEQWKILYEECVSEEIRGRYTRRKQRKERKKYR